TSDAESHQVAVSCLKTEGKMVGAQRFELWTSWSRTRRSTRLSHAPKESTVKQPGPRIRASGHMQTTANPTLSIPSFFEYVEDRKSRQCRSSAGTSPMSN